MIVTGIMFFATLILAALFTSVWTVLLFLASVFFLILFIIFFRNPPRIDVLQDPDSVVAPADGKVVVIEKTTENEFFKNRVYPGFNIHVTTECTCQSKSCCR